MWEREGWLTGWDRWKITREEREERRERRGEERRRGEGVHNTFKVEVRPRAAFTYASTYQPNLLFRPDQQIFFAEYIGMEYL